MVRSAITRIADYSPNMGLLAIEFTISAGNPNESHPRRRRALSTQLVVMRVVRVEETIADVREDDQLAIWVRAIE